MGAQATALAGCLLGLPGAAGGGGGTSQVARVPRHSALQPALLF
jgi:hypothetical protein